MEGEGLQVFAHLPPFFGGRGASRADWKGSAKSPMRLRRTATSKFCSSSPFLGGRGASRACGDQKPLQVFAHRPLSWRARGLPNRLGGFLKKALFSCVGQQPFRFSPIRKREILERGKEKKVGQVTYGTRTTQLPLLPSGPGGVHRRPSHRTRPTTLVLLDSARSMAKRGLCGSFVDSSIAFHRRFEKVPTMHWFVLALFCLPMFLQAQEAKSLHWVELRDGSRIHGLWLDETIQI